MIVVMETNATKEQVQATVKRVEALGLKANVIVGTGRIVVAAIGDKREHFKDSLESGEGVSSVVPIAAAYKMASREVRPDPSRFDILDFSTGGGAVGFIAGPCSVESEAQIMETARAVKAAGATGLRGGAFKPRTSPYSFQGLKEDGLKMMATAREETNLAVFTEVMSTDDVDLVARYADVLQVGARNMQNYRLLEAIGQSGKPVLLKRGASATMDEFLLAAEYILNEGNEQVMLCERGIRTFEGHTRFTLPLASVTYLHRKSHLPVIIDPSHGTGHAYMVPDMAVAAVAAGADGLIIEVHPDPATAMSDGYQSLTFDDFAETMRRCITVLKAVQSYLHATSPSGQRRSGFQCSYRRQTVGFCELPPRSGERSYNQTI
jgi:3-deoxy-7-phosphoheptulonate synthase